MERHGKAGVGINHSETCRARMMHELNKTAVGQERLEKAEERISEALARYIEEADKDAAPPTPADATPATHPTAAPSEGPQPAEANEDAMHDEEPHQAGDDDVEMPTGSITWTRTGRMVRRPLSTLEGVVQAPQSPCPEAKGPSMANAVDMEFNSINFFKNDDEVMWMFDQLGSDTRSHRRDGKQGFRKMITEMWSPPRVTSMASRLPELGLIPGLAMNLT